MHRYRSAARRAVVHAAVLLLLTAASPASAQSGLLVPTLGNTHWMTTALQWNVPGCDRAPMTLPSPKHPTCGGLATAALGTTFTTLLQDRMLGMLADVPAPLRFDAAGAGAVSDFSRSDTFVGFQRVIFYGRLD
jgi:hypothetical protein